jgi:beta-mannan synthase
LHLLVFWVLFENVMSLHRTKATFIGLFDLGRVNEWIVTEKLGNLMKYKMSSKLSGKRSLQRLVSNVLIKGWKLGDRCVCVLFDILPPHASVLCTFQSSEL